jgi:polar amino acid transport system substrate-binding protein
MTDERGGLMRRTIIGAASVGIALVLAGAVGAASRAATFTFCSDPTFPPMELAAASGAISGFDVDMATALARTWGATAKPLKTAFPGLIPALKAKKCDAVISGIFVTPDRLKQAGAVGYMETHRVLIVKAGNPKHVKGPNGLKGLKVVVQAGTKYEEYLKGLKTKLGFSLQSYPGDNDAVAQVIIGRADAILTQDTSFAFQAKQHPGKIAVAYTFPAKDTFGIYYRKGDPVGAKIKSGVAKLKSNGTLGRLAVKYKIPRSDVE